MVHGKSLQEKVLLVFVFIFVASGDTNDHDGTEKQPHGPESDSTAILTADVVSRWPDSAL